MWYVIDFMKLAMQLMPPVLRSPFLMALLHVMLLPLRETHEAFSTLRRQVQDRLSIRANVMYLEKALNDVFFLRNRQIYLETPQGEPPRTLYFVDEGKQGMVMHTCEEDEKGCPVWQKGESQTNINFVIMVPTFLCTSTESKEADRYGWRYYQTIRNMIKTYKPAGRTLSIELYDYE